MTPPVLPRGVMDVFLSDSLLANVKKWFFATVHSVLAREYFEGCRAQVAHIRPGIGDGRTSTYG